MIGKKKTDIGKRLMEWMIDNPMTAEEVADMIGIARQTVVFIVYENKEPRNVVRCKIEKFLKEQKSLEKKI